MFKRDIADHIKKLARQFPVITITGPRQSGKTTLAKTLFPDKLYVNLEELGPRQLAKSDPKEFLSFYKDGAIIDEAQYVPELFSYIQVRVDQKDTPGEFILTGSQNFLMMENITQSLAGRVGVVELLPLSYHEIQTEISIASPYELLVKGFYPRIYNANIESSLFYKSYIQTYVERDVRQIKNIENLDTFQKFMKLCAMRVGQLLNVSALALECGVSQNTAKNWLSLLKTSYIAFTLMPHFKNFNKRLVKQPKLYFYDTGLAGALLDVEEITPEHNLKGRLFENFVVTELIKTRWNQLKTHNLYFWRDSAGHEVDVVFEAGDELVPIEIKASQTFRQEFFKELNYFKTLSQGSRSHLVYAGEEDLPKGVVSWRNVQSILM
ncbi:MAG: ATP-binding protein [Alphaproteobacteria bacterium]|nr:MAG: ATP-binding protein [Alphaproteobacteria bacterium]